MDKRILRTRLAVFNAVIDISSEKKLEDVKVIELCDRAQINKSTFYLHFSSLDDCYAQTSKFFMDKLLNLINDFDYKELAVNPEKTVDYILDIAEQYKNYINRFKNSIIYDNALSYMKNMFYERICNDLGISEETDYSTAVRASFIISGIIDVINRYIDNFNHDELRNAIVDIIKGSAANFRNK